MASPAKQQRMETSVVSGYIHSVSPVKFTTKNRAFFNAVVQTGREEFLDLIMFSLGKRAMFMQAAKNGTAVRLTNVGKDSSAPDFHVVGNQSTEIWVANVTFPLRKPAAPVRQTLVDVTALPADRKVHLLEAKVLAASLEKFVSVGGAEKAVRRYTVSDGTARMSLRVWEKQIDAVEAQSSYAFTDLSTRLLDGKVELTTTINTTIQKICDLDVGEAEGVAEEESVMTVQASLTEAEIKAGVKCVLCGSRQYSWDDQSRFLRCQSCRMLQKSGSFGKVLCGKLKVKNEEGTDYTLTVGHCALVEYLKLRKITTLIDKGKAVEERLLCEGCLEFSFDDEGNVWSIGDLPDTAVPGSSNAACSEELK